MLTNPMLQPRDPRQRAEVGLQRLNLTRCGLGGAGLHALAGAVARLPRSAPAFGEASGKMLGIHVEGVLDIWQASKVFGRGV